MSRSMQQSPPYGEFRSSRDNNIEQKHESGRPLNVDCLIHQQSIKEEFDLVMS